MLQAVETSNQYFEDLTLNSGHEKTPINLPYLIYGLISATLLSSLLASLVRLTRMIRGHQGQNHYGMKILFTSIVSIISELYWLEVILDLCK